MLTRDREITLWPTPIYLPISSAPVLPILLVPSFFRPGPRPAKPLATTQALYLFRLQDTSVHTQEMMSLTIRNCLCAGGFSPGVLQGHPRETLQFPSQHLRGAHAQQAGPAVAPALAFSSSFSWWDRNPYSRGCELREAHWDTSGGGGVEQLACTFCSCPRSVAAVPSPSYKGPMRGRPGLPSRPGPAQDGHSGCVVAWCPVGVCFVLLVDE